MLATSNILVKPNDNLLWWVNAGPGTMTELVKTLAVRTSGDGFIWKVLNKQKSLIDGSNQSVRGRLETKVLSII